MTFFVVESKTMMVSQGRKIGGLVSLPVFLLAWGLLDCMRAESEKGDLIFFEEAMILRPIGSEPFPDTGFVHRRASASVFMWPVDLPVADHRANSILARALLLQYEPQGGATAEAFPDVHEHAFFVLKGRARFTLARTIRDAGPGDLVFAPSNVSHSYEVLGDVPLRMVLMEWRLRASGERRDLKPVVVSESLRPLTRLKPADSGSHQGISASPFVTRQDYPSLSHQGNSAVAWISLQRYDADSTVTATSPHRHATSEQAFFVLSGGARFELSDFDEDVGSGGMVFVPRHVLHGYRVLGQVPVKWLMLSWSEE